MTRIILSEFTAIPVPNEEKLICLIDEQRNQYQLVAVGRYTKINWQNFNPKDYCLLITDKYTCVVPSTKLERTQALVREAYINWKGGNAKDVDLQPTNEIILRKQVSMFAKKSYPLV